MGKLCRGTRKLGLMSKQFLAAVLFTTFVLKAISSTIHEQNSSLPVVLWHGMGASCCISGRTSILKNLIKDNLGVYVLSISTGGNEADQVYAGFFGNLSAQVEATCKIISETEELKGGYNALGLSQGGLFLRAVAERCQHTGPKMRTLVTLGSPHQGVMNVPLCTGYLGDGLGGSSWPCRAMQKLLDWGAYFPWIRTHVVQAQYFKDPYDPEGYLNKNPFLPDVNNERDAKNPQYRTNLQSLDKLVLFRFAGDFTVVPRDSAWFGVFDGTQMLAMKETELYQEDFIGLKHLDKLGKLQLETLPGAHMRFTPDDFQQQILPFLANHSALTI